MRMCFIICGFGSMLCLTPVLSQQIYKEEPRLQLLNPGEKILVDNGECPKGQILEILGGNAPNRAQMNATAAAGGDVYAGGQARQRRCVPRPRRSS
jgi:hypothetical protein